MTDHIWAQEQIASYLTGGLTLEEHERLDTHAKECPACADALTSAIHFDRGLGTLFAPLRPKPGLEDRAVLAVRIAPKPVIFFIGWPRRIATILGAIVVVTTFGALTANVMTNGELPLPGLSRKTETFSFVGSSIQPPRSAAPAGLESNLEAAVDLDRLADKTVNDIVTTDVIGVPNSRTEDTAALKTPGQPAKDFYENAAKDQRAQNYRFSTNGPVPGGIGLAGGNLGMGGGFAGGIVGSGSNTYQRNGQQLFSYYTADGTPVSQVAPTSGPDLKTGLPAPGTSVPPVPANGYFVPYKENERLLKEMETLRTRIGDKPGEGKPGDDKNKADEQVKDGLQPPKPPGGEPKLPGTVVADAPPVAEPVRRVVIRSGDIEFEIESFDAALATVTKLVTGIKGAFVGTVNSDKLPNGKVKGAVVIRTPPEFLDSLVLDLRKELGKGGELKSIKLASADVTKQYTDLESRLKAARAMETRLLAIIKDGKGEIKQLLEAERELGVWRTKIEESEGELRYFANLAALSTLTITLMEKEIRAAVGVTENERVQAGVEVEDVDKTYQQVLKEIVDAKGRVLKSEMKQLSAGQYNATLNFEVAPDAGGPIRDRLRQLGRVARLEIDRQQQAEGGAMPKNATVKRGDTVFMVQIYNLANIAPRETATLSVAVADVPAAYNTMRDAIAKAAGRVQVAQLNENDKQNVTAQLDFDVKRADETIIRAALAAAGDATSRNVVRAAESDSVTDTKILYKVQLYPMSRLKPRDAITLQIAANDVPAAYTTLRDAVLAAKGRVFSSNLDETDKQNVNATLDFELRRTEEPGVKALLEAAGETISRQIAHAAENETATDTKIVYSVHLLPANRLRPRETTVLGLEVADVDNAVAVFTAQFNEVKGRQIDAKSGRERNGKATARLVYEVPYASAAGLVEKFKGAGSVRALSTSRDPQAPDGKSATARIEITLANPDSIVGAEDGVWPPVKKGLTYSFSVLLTSLTYIVFGLCVVLPWALVGYGGYRVVKRVTRTDRPAASSSETAPPAHG